MFILKTKLKKTNNFFNNIKALPSYGLYRWSKIQQLFFLWKKNKWGKISTQNLIVAKYLIIKIFFTTELDVSLVAIHKWIQQLISSYWGIRSELALPVNGQRTRTNASTQRLLIFRPRKRHFVQWWNRRKLKIKKEKNFSKKINKKNDSEKK